jgi:PAS domain S-box-containing protein
MPDETEASKASAVALRESERRLQFALANSPIAVFEQDLDLRFTWIYDPKLGDRAREIVGKIDFDIMDPACASVLTEIKRHVIETGQPSRQEVAVAAPGAPLGYYDLSVEPRRDESGRIVGVISAATDITERKRAEEALRASEAYSRSLFESSPDNVMLISLDGRLEQMNGNGRRKLGIDDFEAFRGRYWPDLWPPGARAGIEAALVEARAGRTGRFSGFCPTEKGVPKWWDVMITAVPGADGSPESLIASSRDVTEHKRAEEAKRNNETLTRLAADAARMTYAEFDFKAGRLNLAENFARVMGYTLPALSEKNDLFKVNEDMLSHIAPEDRARVQAANREFVGGKLDGSATYRVIGDDGAQRWIEGRWTAEVDENGLPVRVVAASLDVTERKRAEDSLRENQQRIQLATEATGVGIWEWNLETDAVWWDSQMFAIYGMPPTEDGFVSYQTWAAAVLPEDLAEQEELLRKHAREGGINRREFRARRRDNGEIRVIEAVDTVRFDGTGEAQGIVGTNLDVTERKRAREKAEDILASIADGFYALDRDWRFVYFNASAESMLGKKRDEVVGLTIFDVFPWFRDSPLHDHYRKAMAGQQRVAFQSQGPDIKRWAAFNVYPTSEGGVSVYFRDISVEKATEAELVNAKAEAERANQAKSKFLAAASHDLRQPVQSLVLLLAVTERQVAGQAKTIETVKMMRAAVDGLHGLLTSVLDISRLDAGVVAPVAESVDLGALVSRLATEYAQKAANMALELRSFPRRLHALTDPSLLARALRNLIENALRYTPNGGIVLGVRRRGESVRIDVIDTGIGIPADKQPEIFEEFHQLHNPGRNLEMGLGLGLAIASRLASLLGAQLEVASRVGRGSRFSLTLPLAQDAAPIVDDRAAIDDPGGRVLIIEDNAIVRGGLEALLRQCGYETFSAVCGEDALDLAAREDWRFDVVVADHRLGVGLSGIETAREIHRRAGRAIPVLMLTGDTDKERIVEIDASGFAILHKPVDAESLRREIARLLRA